MASHVKRFAKLAGTERGIALVTSMMAMLLLTTMGLAIALTATTETAVSANYRRNEQAFFAADAGIGIAREALRRALNNTIQTNANAATSSITFPTATGQAFDDSQLTSILTNSNLIATNGAPATAALNEVNSRASALGSNGDFAVTVSLSQLGSPTLGTRPAPINDGSGALIAQPPSTITTRYGYTITATGYNDIAANSTFRASAQASEQGVISVTLNTNVAPNSVSNPTISRAFSAYAAFFNRFTTTGVLASGTYSGPVHTNERFRFSSSLPLIFQGAVTQSSTTGTYDYNGSAKTVNNTNRTGLTFQSTYTTVDSVPLPTNVYAQELAVLNSTGLADSNFPSGQASQSGLINNLRDADNDQPGSSGSTISNGVYVSSSDGTNITGGGIYVKGNADDIRLTVSGTAQVYRINQGSTTTTITITPPDSSSPGSTVISDGSNTTTFTGVPMDRTDPNNIKPGASLFVNGNISALHGPAASGGATGPAIAGKTGVTITSTGDITLTGDLKYQDTVVNTDGTTATNGLNATNVLGIFTNSGRVNIAPSSTYTTGNYSMIVDAAIATFNESVLSSNPTATTGGIYYSLSSSILNSSSTFTLRGSRIQSAILYIGYGGSNGSKRNVYFDPRFANGAFAPPFFPVTTLANTSTTTTTFALTLSTSNVNSESNTWQRIAN